MAMSKQRYEELKGQLLQARLWNPNRQPVEMGWSVLELLDFIDMLAREREARANRQSFWIIAGMVTMVIGIVLLSGWFQAALH